MVQFRREQASLPAYIRLLHSETAKWLMLPVLSVAHAAVHSFLRGLQGWLQNKDIPVLLDSTTASRKRPISQVGSPPDPHIFRPLRWDKAGRKRERRLEQDHVRAGASALQHVPEVYTDGSYVEEARGVGLAECGVWFGPLDPRIMSFYLRGVQQTNNRAELSASIAALRAVPAAQPLCVVTDSQYVFDGATARLPRWLLLGRNIPHSDLWDELRTIISSRTVPTHWRHVYSHVGVLGNERADSLANQGCLDHLARLPFLREQRARQGLPPVAIPPQTQSGCRLLVVGFFVSAVSFFGALPLLLFLYWPPFLLPSPSPYGWLVRGTLQGPAGGACQRMPTLVPRRWFTKGHDVATLRLSSFFVAAFLRLTGSCRFAAGVGINRPPVTANM